MLSILRADLLKTRKRAMGWAMLAIGLAMVVMIAAVAMFAPAGGEDPIPSFAFPGGLLLGSQVLSQVGGLMMVVFGATIIGSEYGFDTWKNLLTRRPGRGVFIVSKWLTMALALLVGAIMLPLWAQTIGSALGGRLPGGETTAPLGGVLLQIGIGALAPLAAGTVAILGAVLGRSSVAGIVTGIVWLLVDSALAALLPEPLKLVSFTAAHAGLMAHAVAAPAPFGLLASVLVTGSYIAVSLAAAAYLFRRRDLV